MIGEKMAQKSSFSLGGNVIPLKCHEMQRTYTKNKSVSECVGFYVPLDT